MRVKADLRALDVAIGRLYDLGNGVDLWVTR